MAKTTRVTSFRMHHHKYERLLRYAMFTKVSMGRIMNEALTQYLDDSFQGLSKSQEEELWKLDISDYLERS